MKGGTATGFHHVSAELPPNVRKLYRITFTKTGIRKGNLVVREVPAAQEGLSVDCVLRTAIAAVDARRVR